MEMRIHWTPTFKDLLAPDCVKDANIVIGAYVDNKKKTTSIWFCDYYETLVKAFENTG